MKSWKYSDWRVRPHTLYFSLIRCLSGQYFDSGILFISSGQLGTRGERNKGCGGEPFNLNIFNFSFLGPIYSYLGYRISRFRSSTFSLFLSQVSIFQLLQIFIGPFDIDRLSSRDGLFILDIMVILLDPYDFFTLKTEWTNEGKASCLFFSTRVSARCRQMITTNDNH